VVLPELKKKDKPYFICCNDNLRYQWKTFESVVVNYYKLEKEVPTTLFFGDAICAKRYFLGFNALGNGKQFPRYWKTIPKKEVKILLKQVFDRSIEKVWD
jgi:hypothetical protein